MALSSMHFNANLSCWTGRPVRWCNSQRAGWELWISQTWWNYHAHHCVQILDYIYIRFSFHLNLCVSSFSSYWVYHLQICFTLDMPWQLAAGSWQLAVDLWGQRCASSAIARGIFQSSKLRNEKERVVFLSHEKRYPWWLHGDYYGIL